MEPAVDAPMTEITPQTPSEPTRFTAEEYFRLVETGVLGPEDRVELLEGVIVAMTPSGPRHAAVTNHLRTRLERALGDRAAVRQEAPHHTATRSVPEPDIVIVPGTHRDYVRAHPRAALLVVEVADSSLAQDRLTKSRIYAAAGIPEYWIVDLVHDAIEVHRAPDAPRARYADVRRALPGESVAVAAFPHVAIDVSDALLLGA